MSLSGTTQTLGSLSIKKDPKKPANEEEKSLSSTAVFKGKAEAKGGDFRQAAFGPGANATVEGSVSAQGSITQLVMNPIYASKDALDAMERVMNRTTAAPAETASLNGSPGLTSRPF